MISAIRVLRDVKEKARLVKSWADLSNALFDPVNGLLTRAFPRQSDREKFVKTEQFRRIQQLLRKAMADTGLVKGVTPKKSGRFVVRLPLSLHEALDREAQSEKVSLNQLVVAKLAAQLKSLTAR